MENYYEILGIEKSASKADIKKAFRKLAHQYHPDKKGGDEAKFKKINEAYHVLSDDGKRAQYDQYGSAGGGNPGPGGFDFSGFGGAQGFDFSDLFRQAQAGGVGEGADFSDLFNGMFGGGGTRSTRRGRDIAIDVQISFRDSIFGVTRTMLVNKVGTCDICAGKGSATGSKTKQCTTCQGKGMIRESRRSFIGSFTTERPCEACHGSGEVPTDPCKTCAGQGVLKKTEEISVKIPPGISDGEMIRMTGRGEAIPRGSSGDLYIKVHVETHPVFTRDGSNLLMNLKVKLTDALLGSEYMIETLEKELTVKIPQGINNGELLRIKGRGIPMGDNRRGDLMLRIVIDTPAKLSKKAEKLIQELRTEGL